MNEYNVSPLHGDLKKKISMLISKIIQDIFENHGYDLEENNQAAELCGEIIDKVLPLEEHLSGIIEELKAYEETENWYKVKEAEKCLNNL